MKPVLQDKFYDDSLPDDKQRGNCLSAAVASVLELELHEVPNFVEIDDDGGQHWFEHVCQFVKSHGYDYIFWPVEDERCPTPEPGEFYLMAGKSPRGNFYHIVVYRDGEMVHDPHPSGAGILTEEDQFLIRRTHVSLQS